MLAAEHHGHLQFLLQFTNSFSAHKLHLKTQSARPCGLLVHKLAVGRHQIILLDSWMTEARECEQLGQVRYTATP